MLAFESMLAWHGLLAGEAAIPAIVLTTVAHRQPQVGSARPTMPSMTLFVQRPVLVGPCAMFLCIFLYISVIYSLLWCSVS